MHINFCAPGKFQHQMCICTAKNEKDCLYYKASRLDQCMWKSIKLENDIYHCSNRNAQCECRESDKKCDEELLIELEDQDLPI